MRGFYWYCAAGILVGIPFFLPFDFYINPIFLNNISLIFHFSFLSLFMIRVTPKKKYLNIIFIFFLSLIVFFLSMGDLTQHLTYIFSISGLGLTFFCVVYYLQLFNTLPILNLFREPSFWIVNGVFFGMSLIVPLGASLEYFYIKLNYSFYLSFASVYAFCTVIMHIFFIKAFMCCNMNKKVSEGLKND